MDLNRFSKFYTEITDPAEVSHIKTQYKLVGNDQLLSQHQRNPIIFGSLTRYTIVGMSSVSAYNMCLENSKDISKIIQMQNGVQDQEGD